MRQEGRVRQRTNVDGTAGAPSRRRSGQLEVAVLEALWGNPEPLTPAGVQAVFGGELAYNTIHTVLSRLRGKGLVARTTVDGHAAYTPTLNPIEWAAAQMYSLLRRGQDRGAILHQFVNSLSADDESVLRAALDGEGLEIRTSAVKASAPTATGQ
jgi:predicted transcriptional regulator